MALTRAEVAAPPEAVFAVLADASSYGEWVVGSKEIRDAEPHWPAPGSTFHHTQGKGPLVWKDTTSVIESEPPRHLVLEVRVRPWLVNVVELSLEPLNGGRTRIAMYEHPTGGLVARVWNPLFDRLMHARNVEGLRRLGRMAEERSAAVAPSAAA
jgi:uncharacterized protein YndB with AHSA1/START domain